MKFLLLLLSLVLQSNISKYKINIPHERNAIKTPASEKQYLSTPVNGMDASELVYSEKKENREMGLCYNRFRYFDHSSGVYLSQDPIGLAGGIALYGYVHDPNSRVDVFGLYETVVFPVSKVIHETTIKMQGYNNGDFKLANDQDGKYGSPEAQAKAKQLNKKLKNGSH